MLEDFTKETGIKVIYDTFDSNELLETKLLAGRSGYDLVVPTAYFLERQIKAGVFQKLDKCKLPNLGKPGTRSPGASRTYDPGNEYAVNYMWGTTGIGYNVKKAREVLGADARSTAGTSCSSRSCSRSSRIAASTAGCGRRYVRRGAALSRPRSEHQQSGRSRQGRRSPDQAAPVGAQIPFLGISQCARRRAKSASSSAIRATSSRRKSARPKPRTASRSTTRSRRKARSCGSTIWRSRRMRRNVAEAHALINYLLKPDVAAKNTNFISYANGNPASQPLIDKAILDDKTVYPDDATMKTFYTITAHDQKTQRLMNRLWTRIKTGK